MNTLLSLARQANIHSPQQPGKDFISFCLNPGDFDVDPAIRQQVEELLGVARRTSPRYQSYVTMCKGTGCVSSGEIRLKKRFDEILKDRGLTECVRIIETGCRGFCEKGPIVSISPGEAFYCEVQEADIDELVDRHIIGGSIVERLLFAAGAVKENDIAFYRKQERRVLANAGVIDPENIDEAIACETYLGLTKTLFSHSPEEVIDAVSQAGLRGRGGGGFPTGKKWELCRKSTQNPKYVICNADEGDPGAFMDRSILEADPHRLLEGMIICGYAIGSPEGYIYVRAEYPLAVKRIIRAIEQAREYGLLGKNILGSGFDFDIEICQGAGAFVCGEETALISSIEGKRGMPRIKPPYPAVFGLFGKPTNVNNVETFANVPLILNNGVEWYSAMGTDGSPGTKIFALTGKVKNTGLVEVPMGITLRDIIFDIGGGIIDDKEFKAAQTGGPSGGCIPADQLDLQIDFDSLKEIGSMMGSGGLVVLDEHTCMVDLAKFFLQFTKGESCGKCIPCREGTTRMLEILEKITAGKTDDPEDIERLKTLSDVIIKTSACGLGMSAPNPVLSTLHYFEDEYRNHIIDKKCPAGTCKNFLSYVILASCKGCGACKRVCPVACITGEKKELHTIDQEVCIKCGACFEKCKFEAIGIQ
jgi:NADH:ubiquinone oxidoreductase subunit F (NADH-binding)/(2Fe-2S) ferredoxin/Pyruvate/2-oxoacid:ferredoxin oxidoreductase delta subunit